MGLFPLGNGGEGVGVEGEGAVGGAHDATSGGEGRLGGGGEDRLGGSGEGGLGGGGDGEEQQAVAVVDSGGQAGACTGVGVECDLRLVTAGGEKSGDGSLPGGELPLDGAHT